MHCIYVFHTFTVGLATLAVYSYAVVVECYKIMYKNIHILVA
jgi:hypothetical protein